MSMNLYMRRNHMVFIVNTRVFTSGSQHLDLTRASICHYKVKFERGFLHRSLLRTAGLVFQACLSLLGADRWPFKPSRVHKHARRGSAGEGDLSRLASLRSPTAKREARGGAGVGEGGGGKGEAARAAAAAAAACATVGGSGGGEWRRGQRR